MPYLSIRTNHEINKDKQEAFLIKASSIVAKELGKLESYVMVAFSPPQPMMFAGSDDGCAFVELKSIGLAEDKTASLSNTLCDLVETELNISGDRTYVEFLDAPRKVWGRKGGTF